MKIGEKPELTGTNGHDLHILDTKNFVGEVMNYYQPGNVRGMAFDGRHRCPGIMHTVRKGDTLYRISRMYGVGLEQVMDANPDVNVYNLSVGSMICVPMAVPAGGMRHLGNSFTGDEAGIESLPPRSEGQMTPQGHVGREYIVAHGESIGDILKKFNMDYENFIKYNPELLQMILPEGRKIYVKDGD